MEKRSNPIQVVQINNTDHRKLIYTGFGSSKIFGDGATPERRSELAQQTTDTSQYFAALFAKWPGISVTAKVTLKEESVL